MQINLLIEQVQTLQAEIRHLQDGWRKHDSRIEDLEMREETDWREHK